MNAKAWFYGTSFHSSTPVEKERQAPTEKRVVERWDGQKWVEHVYDVPIAEASELIINAEYEEYERDRSK